MGLHHNECLSLEEKADLLISKMTLKEKCGQLNQKMYGWEATVKSNDDYHVSQKFKDEVNIGDGLGALYGLFRADPWSGVNCSNAISVSDSPKVSNMLQRYVIENTRLGIPVMFSEECPHGHQAIDSTIFSTNLGVGATFNPKLYKQAFSKVAQQLRARGASLALISCLDIAQDPRWGRTEECFGEDPYLSYVFTKSVVAALQGENFEDLRGDKNLIAVVKHFCAQGAAVGGHNGKHTVIGEREMREIHIPPMIGAIEAGAMSCMAAYNDIDGVYCHANKYLLTNILRDELGFDGFVMSDGCAIDILTNVTREHEKAAALALSSGVDLNLWSVAYTKLEKAVNQNKVSIADIDKAVKRILVAKLALGLFEKPYVDEELINIQMQDKSIDEVNLQQASESIVMLKNDGILPIREDVKKIAVIGPNADNIYNMLGDYTPEQRQHKKHTIFNAITESFEGAVVEYCKGCEVRGKNTSEFDKAVELAKSSDVVILAMGSSSARESDMELSETGAAVASNLSEMNCGEGADLADVELDGLQKDLIKAIVETKTPTVLVLVQGRAHAIEWESENCNAILSAWYPGEQGSKAIARVLKGDVNPSGRLPISVPRSSAQLPVYYNYKSVNDYVDMSGTALYPFGYGLSYSEFKYSNLKVNCKEITKQSLESGDCVKVSVDITNTSEVDGYETAQLYIFDVEASVTRRNRELKGFEKVFIKGGETKTVEFVLDKQTFTIFSSNNKYEIELGNVEIYVGQSCLAKDMINIEIV